MFCCGGAEEENAGPPANQYTAPPKGNPVGGKYSLCSIMYLTLFFLHIYTQSITITISKTFHLAVKPHLVMIFVDGHPYSSLLEKAFLFSRIIDELAYI